MKENGEREKGAQDKKEEKAAKAEELEKQLLRLAAEFENYKKRIAKEQGEWETRAKAQLLLKILGVVDEFELALAHLKHSDECVRKGVEMIYVKLMDLLKSEGVVEMEAEGKEFDPYLHEAVREEEGPKGKVIHVLQKGYLYNNNVLRHAKVVVGKGGDVDG